MKIGSATPKAQHPIKLALLFGISVFFLGFVFESMIRISYFVSAANTLPPDGLAFFRENITNIWINIVIILVTGFAAILAGFVTGTQMKKTRWIYGGMIGLIWVTITTTIVVLYFMDGIKLAAQLGSTPYVQENYTQNNLNIFLMSVPAVLFKTIILSTLGGLIADVMSARKDLAKKTEEVTAKQPTPYEELIKRNSY